MVLLPTDMVFHPRLPNMLIRGSEVFGTRTVRSGGFEIGPFWICCLYNSLQNIHPHPSMPCMEPVPEDVLIRIPFAPDQWTSMRSAPPRRSWAALLRGAGFSRSPCHAPRALHENNGEKGASRARQSAASRSLLLT